jgi:hypothetical protein
MKEKQILMLKSFCRENSSADDAIANSNAAPSQ